MIIEMILLAAVRFAQIGVMIFAIAVLFAYGRYVLPDAFEPIAGLYVIQLTLAVFSIPHDLTPRVIETADWAWMLYSFAMPVLVTKIILSRKKTDMPYKHLA